MLALVTLLLVLVPWPGPLEPRPPCPREKATLVRKLVNKRWIPILEKYSVAMPLECPLHQVRDVFAEHYTRKLHHPPQWTCGFCGKSFYHESQLDRHFDNRHSEHINEAEDSVCVADFCDVMRCEVLLERMRDGDGLAGTALDVWQQPLVVPLTSKGSSGEQAVERAAPRSLMRTQPWPQWTPSPSPSPAPPPPSSSSSSTSSSSSQGAPVPPSTASTTVSPALSSPTLLPDEGVSAEGSGHLYECSQEEEEECPASDEPLGDEDEFGDSPREVPLHPLHSWKDTCNEEHLAELRVKCQHLIQQCISGLLLNLTMDQFTEIEASLNRAVCWYLTCDRYWEAGSMETPEFPWGLVTALILLLTLGISLCYYIVWVLCESYDTVSSPSSSSQEYQNSSVPPAPRRVRTTPATESESECRDSGFNEGSLYPDPNDTGHAYSDYDSQSFRSRHYSGDSRLSYAHEDQPYNSRMYLHEERIYNYSTSFMPNYEQRRARRNRYNYVDDFDEYPDADNEKYYDPRGLTREHSDGFIYVTYPPDIKKRFTESR
ncbi:uncharacterized protein LOC143036844 isoform X2 [Oratosquilla oratoria]|uniref:uncharacterized protein LOC143036844 isoform X2 n=1 Tax=Oratosquilla oratoria TaxID=337810 RepID=UPI003F75E9DA